MPFRQPKLPKAGEQISSRELRKFMDEVSRVLNLNAIPPLFVRRGTTFDIGIDDDGAFPAKITGVTFGSSYGGYGYYGGCSYGYSWVEQMPAECGTWVDKPFGRQGDYESHPAFEMNGNVDVEPGTYVEMKRGHPSVNHGLEYYFKHDGAGGYEGFCIDIEKQRCDPVTGQMVDDSIAIHSKFPIWMTRARCAVATGQSGKPGRDNECPPGYVDTAACSNVDCNKEQWQIIPGQLDTVTEGTCGLCASWHQGFTLIYRGSCEWVGSAGVSDGCGPIGVRLYYAAPYYRLVFSNGTKEIHYILNGLNWNPGGPNTLSRLGVANRGWCDGWPDFITVS